MAPFLFRRRNKSVSSRDQQESLEPKSPTHEPYFGEIPARGSQAVKPKAATEIRESGELLLLKFIKKRLGTQAEGLAIRLMNKTPIKDGSSFTYQINQSTEESDLQIVLRDLIGGRLYRSGTKYIGPSWANLLYGDKFTTGGNKKQVHELLYVRTSCSCITCLINFEKGDSDTALPGDDIGSSVTSSSSYTPENSAMANFVRPLRLPKVADLKLIGGLSSWRELEIGTILRLNSRNAAKLKFTEDIKNLFCHFCYTGPMSHEHIYRKVTTIGVDYYVYNKGKKERKVYLQGNLIQLSLEMGVVKLGTKPLRTDEVGAYYLAYRRQILQIYVGELVLEGNSFGSFIPTGIKCYVGVGEEGGCSPIYSNNTLGPPRRLGVNELLLHHHMVDDLKVRLR